MGYDHTTVLGEKLRAYEVFDNVLCEGFGYPVFYTDKEADERRASLSDRYKLILWKESEAI